MRNENEYLKQQLHYTDEQMQHLHQQFIEQSETIKQMDA
jgi:hypothetical protein